MRFKIGLGVCLVLGVFSVVAYYIAGIWGFFGYNVSMVVYVIFAIRNAVRNYDELKDMGVDIDELENVLKKINGGIEIYYDLFGLVIEVPRGVDKNEVLQYIPEGVKVRVKRKCFSL